MTPRLTMNTSPLLVFPNSLLLPRDLFSAPTLQLSKKTESLGAMSFFHTFVRYCIKKEGSMTKFLIAALACKQFRGLAQITSVLSFSRDFINGMGTTLLVSAIQLGVRLLSFSAIFH